MALRGPRDAGSLRTLAVAAERARAPLDGRPTVSRRIERRRANSTTASRSPGPSPRAERVTSSGDQQARARPGARHASRRDAGSETRADPREPGAGPPPASDAEHRVRGREASVAAAPVSGRGRRRAVARRRRAEKSARRRSAARAPASRRGDAVRRVWPPGGSPRRARTVRAGLARGSPCAAVARQGERVVAQRDHGAPAAGPRARQSHRLERRRRGRRGRPGRAAGTAAPESGPPGERRSSSARGRRPATRRRRRSPRRRIPRVRERRPEPRPVDTLSAA